MIYFWALFFQQKEEGTDTLFQTSPDNEAYSWAGSDEIINN